MVTISNINFTDPVNLSTSVLPASAGLYVIFKTPLPKASSDAVYVGQAGNIKERVTVSHERYACWASYCGRNIYVAWCQMPNSTEAVRLAAEQAVIRALNPPCNRT